MPLPVSRTRTTACFVWPSSFETSTYSEITAPLSLNLDALLSKFPNTCSVGDHQPQIRSIAPESESPRFGLAVAYGSGLTPLPLSIPMPARPGFFVTRFYVG